MSEFEQTDSNRLRRIPDRGHYDKGTIYSILDAGYLCHSGFVVDGQPFVIPTLYARDKDNVLIHGSAVSRMLKEIDKGIEVCITVTHVDGIVLARSAFNHSMNYRSAVVFGVGKAVVENDKKLDALRKISDNVLRGRWEDSRQPTEKELNVTSVIKIPIREASAKIREGDPIDDARDYDFRVWAGVLPVISKFGDPVPDAKLDADIEIPGYLKEI